MTEQERLKLNAIDINGLNKCDRDRIEAIGLSAWLNETASAPRPQEAIPIDLPDEFVEFRMRQRTHLKNCALCGHSFTSRRGDALYCSARCRQRGTRSQCHRSQKAYM